MNAPTPEILAKIRLIADAICESVAVAGTHGAPGGILYSALMAHGCTLDQFNSIMGAMIRAGRLVKRGECYFIAGKVGQ